MIAIPTHHRSRDASVSRIRRLIHLEDVLADCRTLIRSLPDDSETAHDSARRIGRAQAEIDRLRGVEAPPAAADPAMQQALEGELRTAPRADAVPCGKTDPGPRGAGR
ncbi:hypothetical protein [Sphingomicrobium astaxanthinifaciens]|uniref:hypothetical protein n=1 Tax=Sphingomicrobium astaxanthinifaciens TaxID=1227949 RepID=UPI001FCC8389|nr:hypothetical protein [Sphingomicrobium astaxanthinifaciens]MCJ7421917.1 hypothetical protein [Sphingomicrobium astaxanthinifaciens]